MPKHKSEDYKLSAVNYYLTENNNQLQKKEGLTYNNLKRNIKNVIEEIPKIDKKVAFNLKAQNEK